MPTFPERLETALVALAAEHIRLYGSVLLGAAQTEIFLRHLPATRIEPADNPRLFKLTRPHVVAYG